MEKEWGFVPNLMFSGTMSLVIVKFVSFVCMAGLR